MAFTLSSPVTGGAQTGLTSPTYTLLADSPPDAWSKQYYVSALGGTQTGVNLHSVASPFTISMYRPRVLQSLSPVNPSTGVLPAVPMNQYKMFVRKGVLPLAGQAFKTANAKVEFNIPAGSDLADNINLRAMISLLVGALNQLSNELGNTVTTGTI